MKLSLLSDRPILIDGLPLVDIIAEAVKAEREACAKIAEAHGDYDDPLEAVCDIAKAIRNRQ